MPNSNEHIGMGALVTGFGSFIVDLINQNNEVNMGLRTHVDLIESMGKGFICAGGGIIGSMIPDTIDPPDHPNHRSHAHSFGSLVLSYLLLNGDPLSENYIFNLFLKGVIAGNGVHLLQDSQTSKGLNFL